VNNTEISYKCSTEAVEPQAWILISDYKRLHIPTFLPGWHLAHSILEPFTWI